MFVGRRLIACAALVAVTVLAGCSFGANADGPSGAPGSPEALVSTKCTLCHSLDRVNGAIYDEAQWTRTVERMQQNGLVVTEEEKTAIITYLAKRDASR